MPLIFGGSHARARGFTWNDLNNGFAVGIKIEAKPRGAEMVAGLLTDLDLVSPTMAESGVKLLSRYRSPTTPLWFFIFELYVDEVGWGAHQETAHFKACLKNCCRG